MISKEAMQNRKKNFLIEDFDKDDLIHALKNDKNIEININEIADKKNISIKYSLSKLIVI